MSSEVPQFFSRHETLEMVRRLPKFEGKVYGMRRMAVPLAFAYAALHGNELVESPEQADIIIDDTMGGNPSAPGGTYRKMAMPEKVWLVLMYNPACGIPLSDKVHCAVQGDPSLLPRFPMERDLIRSEFSRTPWASARPMSAHAALFSRRMLPSAKLAELLRPPVSVLVLEDLESRIAEFRSRLPDAEIVSDAARCIERLSTGAYTVVFLDHDLVSASQYPTDPEGQNTGSAVARYIAAQPPEKRPAVVVHSSNPVGARYMLGLLPEAWYRPNAQRLITPGMNA